MKVRSKPLVLSILDGFGYGRKTGNNTIALANTPCRDFLQRQYPIASSNCFAPVAGLPDEQMGHSEAGHLHGGGGLCMPQDRSSVNDAINDGTFFENPGLCEPADQAKAKNKAFHDKDCFVTLTEYRETFNYSVAFTLAVKNGLSETLSRPGPIRLRLAETEKYTYVTFFLNGGADRPFLGEDRILVSSPQVRTDDPNPEIGTAAVIDHLPDERQGKKYDVIICNYANCDRVGGTGMHNAAIIVLETIDRSPQGMMQALGSAGGGGQMLETANCGNTEHMLDEQSGQAHAARATNLLSLVSVLGNRPWVEGDGLSNLAPAMPHIPGMAEPVEMTGRSIGNSLGRR